MLVRPVGRDQRPWNRGLLIGQKKPLEPKHVWSIRVRLEIARSWRDLVIFNLAMDSKLRLRPGQTSIRRHLLSRKGAASSNDRSEEHRSTSPVRDHGAVEELLLPFQIHFVLPVSFKRSRSISIG
jgi:hypothetical protein